MKFKEVTLFGATGLIGGYLLKALLKDSTIHLINVVGRKPFHLKSERTLVLGISNSSASLLLILIAPFLGLLADRNGNKLKYLALSAFIGITPTL